MGITQFYGMSTPTSFHGTTASVDRIHICSLVDVMMRQVRTTYIKCLTRVGGLPESYRQNQIVIKWDGGTYRDGTQWRPIWPRLLRAIVQLQTTPEIYISAQFDPDFGEPTMTPMYLDNRRARNRYAKLVARSRICVIEQFARDEREARRIASLRNPGNEQAAGGISRSMTRGMNGRRWMSPLVACCNPELCGAVVDEIMRNRATMQLAFQLADFVHSPVWDRIPDELRDQTERLVSFICYDLETEYPMG